MTVERELQCAETHPVADVFLGEAVQLVVVEDGVPARLCPRAGVLHVFVELVLAPRLSHRARVS